MRAVIITGEGPAFVAGADIRAMMTKNLRPSAQRTRTRG